MVCGFSRVSDDVNDCANRDALLNQLTRHYIDENGKLDFEPMFAVADRLLEKFLSTAVVDKRASLNQWNVNGIAVVHI